jgi:hypothetical protein
VKWPSLESPRAKIDWASKHFEVLDRKGRAWEKSHPYRVRGQLDREAREYVGGLTVNPRPHPELSLLLGDFVHNLRSALDHLVWQLVIANGQVPGKSNQFPVATTEAEWKRCVKELGWLKGVEAEAVAVIKRLQPYCGKGTAAKHLLAALNALDISDKHHVLATGALGIVPPDIEQGRAWGYTVHNGEGALSGFSLWIPFPVIEDDADFMKFRFESMSSDFEMEMKDDLAALELRFGETGKLGELSASLDELAKLGYYVQHVADQFDPDPPKRPVEFVD